MADMELAEILREARRLDEAATKGPWIGDAFGSVRAESLDGLSIGYWSQALSSGRNCSYAVTPRQAAANAALAAFARTALPRLARVAEAAMEMRRLINFFDTSDEFCAAVARFDAAVRGEP